MIKKHTKTIINWPASNVLVPNDSLHIMLYVNVSKPCMLSNIMSKLLNKPTELGHEFCIYIVQLFVLQLDYEIVGEIIPYFEEIFICVGFVTPAIPSWYDVLLSKFCGDCL